MITHINDGYENLMGNGLIGIPRKGCTGLIISCTLLAAC